MLLFIYGRTAPVELHDALSCVQVSKTNFSNGLPRRLTHQTGLGSTIKVLEEKEDLINQRWKEISKFNINLNGFTKRAGTLPMLCFN